MKRVAFALVLCSSVISEAAAAYVRNDCSQGSQLFGAAERGNC
jgi:hypothetical protein